MLLYLESHVLNHLPGLLVALAWRGQVAGDEERVGWIQGQGLELPQMVLSAAGNPDFLRRAKHPHQA